MKAERLTRTRCRVLTNACQDSPGQERRQHVLLLLLLKSEQRRAGSGARDREMERWSEKKQRELEIFRAERQQPLEDIGRTREEIFTAHITTDRLSDAGDSRIPTRAEFVLCRVGIRISGSRITLNPRL